jgi:hypothetical protein
LDLEVNLLSAHSDAYPEVTDDVQPENIPEYLIWWVIIWTYPLWMIGGLYIVGSVLGWLFLLFLLIKVLAQDADTPADQRLTLSWVLWIWIAGMLLMEVALLAGHLDFNLGFAQIIKSSIGWAKGWASLALYPLAGCLRIRPQIIYRAVCILGFQTLIITPALLVAPYINLPQVLYVSPLSIVGGPGPEFFDVRLFEIDPTTDQVRLRLFTPWAPALGFVGNVYFMISLQEKHKKWRMLGLAGAVVMCLICRSRLAQLCLVLIPVATALLSRLKSPATLLGLGMLSFLSGIFSPSLLAQFDQFWQSFKSARADSTRVRMALKRIAIYRWESEAPIWGHGVVERGGHVVEWMPIGSHHTWAGLLFVKGFVGFLALAVPMLASFFDLLIKSNDPRQPSARVGLSMVMMLFLYTFGENLEILVYLYWPGLILMGIAFQEKHICFP